MHKDIYVCVGSSCHLKGSYDIIQTLEKLIGETGVDATLNASFCLGRCADGVSVRVNEEIHTGIKPETAEEFFFANIVD